MTSPFANFAAGYREQGLAVLPCGPGTKFPGRYSTADGWFPEYNWQKYCDRLPSHFEADIWDRWPDGGICLALGRSSAPAGMQLIAMDIDTEEAIEVAAIRAVLPGSPVRKRGAKGETEFYLAPASVPNRPYNDRHKRRMLDLLGHGRQTVLPPTIHPDTNAAYHWTTLDTLETFDIRDLPVLPADIADILDRALAPFGHVAPPSPVEGAAGDAEVSTHRDLNDTALGNLAAWVPHLGLYKCRQVGGKYKAVAHWRPSSGGRALSDRATNLIISPAGIKDKGAEKGYTPLDLVMAARNENLDTAFRWLQERVAPAAIITLAPREIPSPAPPPRVGNLVGLRLATFDGVAVQPGGEHDQAEDCEYDYMGNLALSPRVIEAEPDIRVVSESPLSLLAGNHAILPTSFVFRDPSTLPRREWLYGRHLIRGEISLTLAPGGVGKTSLAVAEAASLVSGRQLLHDDPGHPLRVWLWNGEEPEDELMRRLAAAGLHYNLKADDFGDRLFIDTGHALPLVLAEQGRDGVRVSVPMIDRLVDALRARSVDVMLIDPFVSTHSVNENDNSAIQRAASAWKEVAHRANVAIGLAHHTRKLAGREATAEDSRGGDALVSKARDARALNPMSTEDAGRLGIKAEERGSFFSTGVGGKSNMSPKGSRKTWFQLVSVSLGNGDLTHPADQVAVVAPWHPPVASDAINPTVVLRLARIMAGRQWRAPPQASKREDWIGRAVAEAFEIGTEDGFETHAKRIIALLEKAGILLKADAVDRNRNVIKVSGLCPRKMAEFEVVASVA